MSFIQEFLIFLGLLAFIVLIDIVLVYTVKQSMIVILFKYVQYKSLEHVELYGNKNTEKQPKNQKSYSKNQEEHEETEEIEEKKALIDHTKNQKVQSETQEKQKETEETKETEKKEASIYGEYIDDGYDRLMKIRAEKQAKFYNNDLYSQLVEAVKDS